MSATPVASGNEKIFVIGGNASTLAFVSDFRAENKMITAHLVPLAWTPLGVVLGEGWQRVRIPADNVAGWVDDTFPPNDERAFVAPLREIDLLVRTGWGATTPDALTESMVLNPEDVPEDVLDGLASPAEALTSCAVCRRSCVRDHFVWNERRLCAWDYHAIVFGKRGPWRSEPYEERFWETLPAPAYVVPGLLDEANVDAILAVSLIDESLARTLVDTVMRTASGPAYLAVRTAAGLTLLREREPAS